MTIHPPLGQPRIAVIGAGIAGLGAAHRLSDFGRVTLFEAEARLGGHARTVLAGRHGDQPVDTGFIVFNHATYPNLCALFDALEVPTAPSNMTFAASIDDGRVEYALSTLNGLFGQRANALSPGFWGMMRDVMRFNARAEALAADPSMTIAQLLDRLGAGARFRDQYLLPFSGAIWSTPTRDILDFPAAALVRFFRNHALLGVTGQHQWYTVRGGSVEYVRRLEAALRAAGVEIRTGCAVAAVDRASGVRVRPAGGDWESFDEVVLATHGDDSLRLLADPDPVERRHLGAIRYQSNDAVLHCDPALMPRRRRCWASWNYTEGPGGAGRGEVPIALTYWMNSLQPIPHDDLLFVSLNVSRPIRDACIFDQVTFRHPMYDTAALEAQAALAAYNGTRGTWVCGAWMRNGFHEDGLATALEVADALARRYRQAAA